MSNQNDDDCSERVYVGYSGKTVNIIMIFISIFGILINATFSYNYSKKIYSSQKTRRVGVSLVEKVLCVIAVIETLISLCWLIDNCFFFLCTENKEDSTEISGLGKVIAYCEIFLYLFDWMILSTSLFQIKIIILNPQRILESGKMVTKYIITCFSIALLSIIIAIIFNLRE